MEELTFSELMTGPKEAFDVCYCAHIGDKFESSHYHSISFDDLNWLFKDDEDFSRICPDMACLKKLSDEQLAKATVSDLEVVVFIRKSRELSQFNSFVETSRAAFEKWIKPRLKKRTKQKQRKRKRRNKNGN